jgi:hypothetical protein
MKKTITTAFLLLFVCIAFAGDDDFVKHSGEIFITPSADYFFGKKENEPYQDKFPFIGFGFGANYLYRPVKVFGVSAGLGHKMQGGYFKTKQNLFLYNITTKGNMHVGYLTVPIQFHLFKKVEVSDFEFTTGPEFNIPLYSRSSVRVEDSRGPVNTSKSMTVYTADQRKRLAALGWVVSLGAHRDVNDHLGIYAGVDLRFLDIASLDKDTKKGLDEVGPNGIYNCSLGVRIGFRLH